MTISCSNMILNWNNTSSSAGMEVRNLIEKSSLIFSLRIRAAMISGNYKKHNQWHQFSSLFTHLEKLASLLFYPTFKKSKLNTFLSSEYRNVVLSEKNSIKLRHFIVLWLGNFFWENWAIWWIPSQVCYSQALEICFEKRVSEISTK